MPTHAGSGGTVFSGSGLKIMVLIFNPNAYFLIEPGAGDSTNAHWFLNQQQLNRGK